MTALKRQNIGIDFVCLCMCVCWICISKSAVPFIHVILKCARLACTQRQIGAVVHYAALSDFASHFHSSSFFSLLTHTLREQSSQHVFVIHSLVARVCVCVCVHESDFCLSNIKSNTHVFSYFTQIINTTAPESKRDGERRINRSIVSACHLHYHRLMTMVMVTIMTLDSTKVLVSSFFSTFYDFSTQASNIFIETQNELCHFFGERKANIYEWLHSAQCT